MLISSSSPSQRGFWPFVDPLRSHTSRSRFFCLLACCSVVFFSILGNLLWDLLFICCNQFLLYSCILSKSGVLFNSFAISVFVLYSVQVYPTLFLICFVSAAVILLASLALMFQFLLRCNEA